MPPLVRFLLRHAAIGFMIAVAFVGGMVWFDLGGLRGLARASVSGPLALALLTFAIGMTFSSVQMGFAVMLLGAIPDGDGGKRSFARLASHALPVARKK
jgi:hypothetical protein